MRAMKMQGRISCRNTNCQMMRTVMGQVQQQGVMVQIVRMLSLGLMQVRMRRRMSVLGQAAEVVAVAGVVAGASSSGSMEGAEGSMGAGDGAVAAVAVVASSRGSRSSMEVECRKSAGMVLEARSTSGSNHYCLVLGPA
jgi:hypothetical protein